MIFVGFIHTKVQNFLGGPSARGLFPPRGRVTPEGGDPPDSQIYPGDPPEGGHRGHRGRVIHWLFHRTMEQLEHAVLVSDFTIIINDIIAPKALFRKKVQIG